MALLQQALSPTIHKIYEQREKTQSSQFLNHIPTSMMGDKCIRSIWYDYRFCEEFDRDGVSLRELEINKLKTSQVINELSSIGCVVSEIDKRTGQRWSVSDFAGHIGGDLDAIIESGLEEAPGKAHILKVVCTSTKQFNQIKLAGTEKAAPFTFADVQSQMQLMEIDRSFCVFVCNDSNELFAERVKLDKEQAKFFLDRIGGVICSDSPPVGISENDTSATCKGCRFNDVCHNGHMVKPTCRNCVHVTCEREEGGWSCSKWNSQIPFEAQQSGCPSHLYNPSFMHGWEVSDANDEEQWVKYKKGDKELTNAVEKKNGYTSAHLYACPPELIDDQNLFEIMAKFDAEIVK